MTAIIPASAWRHQRAAASEARTAIPERRGRCRVMLAMLGFFVLYGVLAARLVLLGVGAHGDEEDRAKLHPLRLAGSPRHYRPQRRDARDRHPHRRALRRAALCDRSRRGDGAPRHCPSRPRPRSAAAASLHRCQVRLYQARDHAAPAAGDPQARHSRHRLPRREPSLLPGRRGGRARARHGQHRQSRDRRDRKVHRRCVPERPAGCRLRDRRRARAGPALARPPRPARRARRAGAGDGSLRRRRRDRHRARREYRRGARHELGAGL